VPVNAPPDDRALAELLGPAFGAWRAIVAEAGLAAERRHYGAKHGWQLLLVAKKRTVLYLIPKPGRFTAAAALDADALTRARDALPADVLAAIDAAPPARAGRPARIDVTSEAQVGIVSALVGAKLGTRLPSPAKLG
jgi:hypothetical protein